MIDLYRPVLEAALAVAQQGGDPLVPLRGLPLALFARVMVQPQAECPALAPYLPSNPEAHVQRRYNGRSGLELLPSSVGFVNSVCAAYVRHAGAPLPARARILDHGCGWGRLIRTWYWRVAPDQVHGLDPCEEALELCRSHGLGSWFGRCDEIPTALPLPLAYFHLVYAFSVFTHLGPAASQAVMASLLRHVRPDGMVAITIRPIEFWEHSVRQGRITADVGRQMTARHRETGVAFLPARGGWARVAGEVQFGDATMGLEYLANAWRGWRVVGTDMVLGEPLQVHVFLVPEGQPEATHGDPRTEPDAST